MLISKKMNAAINQQIGNEFGASMQYVAIAAHFAEEGLEALAAISTSRLRKSASHAMRFVHYIVDAGGKLEIRLSRRQEPPSRTWRDAGRLR